MMLFLRLFFEFFKTGLFAVGGGMATIPFLYDMAEATGWFTDTDLVNMIAVGESTPGPIGVNMATYAGYQAGYAEFGFLGGILGGLVATLSLVLPSVIVILIIAGFLEKFKENKLVKNTFYCLRPAVIGMLAVTLLGLIFPIFINLSGAAFLEIVNIKAIILFAVILFGVLKFKKHPILYIGIGALVGIIFKF